MKHGYRFESRLKEKFLEKENSMYFGNTGSEQRILSSGIF
jgi:hypothetical protein